MGRRMWGVVKTLLPPASYPPFSNMDTSKYKALYLQEAGEHVAGIEQGLLALEKNLADSATVDALFRHYHSIKGMSASMGYVPIQKLAHAQEDLLDNIRSKKLSPAPGITNTLFECLDAMKGLIRKVEEDSPLGDDVAPFAAKIKAVMEAASSAPEGGASTLPPQAKEAAVAQPSAPAGIASTADLKLSHVMKVEGRVFDELLSCVGDLVMALSSFKTLTQMSRSVEFKDGIHTLGKAIAALHGNILSARMLPISDLTEGLPRVIRDISQRSGKEVSLKIEGAELKLDRAILEGLGSPLVHIIRNAVDHGIESMAEREKAGKPREGTIIIKAYRRRERVIIEVSDDGKGINVEKIKKKAIAAGIAEGKVSSMTDKEAWMLVCLPGVTSADTVTDTSGRGVGMDVVKGVIDGLGGFLEIESAPGAGTRIILELPLTTAIIKTLLVAVKDEIFLLPLARIERVIEVSCDSISSGVYKYGDADVPVVPLGAALGMSEGPDRDKYTLIIVETKNMSSRAPRLNHSGTSLSGEGTESPEASGRTALRVDAFGDEIDAYVKPLLPPIAKLWGVSGITVMGDGRAVFLVDVGQITSNAVK
ncbi:MAG: chemotaxis protein CheA [Deltaproteobacteria bacterium]|nr:chemotaxis protein CheA [Deltaproteobacteria bacterium]